MPYLPRKLLIVGGGVSGWMAAAYLDAVLNRDGRRVADIALVGSPYRPRVGAGEATIPSINHFLAVVGLGANELLRRVDGTLNQAIRYDNWLDNRGESHYHPFNRFRESPIDRTGRRWLSSDRSIPFAETVSIQPALCRQHRSPQMLGPWDLGPPLTHAYHMDAIKFAGCLGELATGRGVRHYRERVADVDVGDDGSIVAIQTASGLRLDADLYIDCTGFDALLAGQKLGVPWIDCSRWLLCDRALTMDVPYERLYPGHIRSCTTATALSAGWVREIPLQNRRSLGYVYAGDFLDPAAADRELRNFEGVHAEELETRVVHFRVGHRERAWTHNCIAFGLAGNCIEPLEATGVYLSDLASVMLAEHFPYRNDMEALAFRFNRIMLNRFYEILDFVNLHYCLTRRNDSDFWREVQRPERINDRLRAKLDYWRIKPPSPSDFEDQFLPGMPRARVGGNAPTRDDRPPVDTADLFGIDSYEAILYGMDFLRAECDGWFGSNRPATQVARPIVERVAAALDKLPTHDVWLQQVLGAPQFAPDRHPSR